MKVGFIDVHGLAWELHRCGIKNVQEAQDLGAVLTKNQKTKEDLDCWLEIFRLREEIGRDQ